MKYKKLDAMLRKYLPIVIFWFGTPYILYHTYMNYHGMNQVIDYADCVGKAYEQVENMQRESVPETEIKQFLEEANQSCKQATTND